MDFLLDKSNPDYWKHFNALVQRMKMSDNVLIVTVKKKTGKRTLPMNNYYWLILGYIQSDTGVSALALHWHFKLQFIPTVVFREEFDLSTADLSIEEMSNYINSVREFALTDLNIPTPDAMSVNR